MFEHSYDDFDDADLDAPKGELVHWMEPRPLAFGPAGVSLAVAGAFALGLATALIALSVSRMGPLERKLRRLS
jgi:hypothetical protein